MVELVSKKEIKSGLGISQGKLDQMIKRNEIPHIRMGKVIRFDYNEVLNELKK
jgi:excisionase family DNA binding protein